MSENRRIVEKGALRKLLEDIMVSGEAMYANEIRIKEGVLVKDIWGFVKATGWEYKNSLKGV